MNNRYEVNITDITHDGRGVGKIDNFPVFVNNAIPGETVIVEIVKKNKNYGLAKLVKITNVSPNRYFLVCKYNDQCGGCGLQQINYSYQLELKGRIIENALNKIGGIKDAHVQPTIGMKKHLNYRNNVQYHVSTQYGKVVAGFYKGKTHEVVDEKGCYLSPKINEQIKYEIVHFIQEHDLSVYDRFTGNGLVRSIVIRNSLSRDEIMVILVINGYEFSLKHEFCNALVSRFSNIKSIALNINTQKSDIIFGKTSKIIYGNDFITESILGLKFNISPTSFFQINSIQTEVLYNKILEYAELTGKEIVFDLYCGVGAIAISLALKAKYLYGIEISTVAIANARTNAQINKVNNIKFIEGDVTTIVPTLFGEGVCADIVIVDPPRKGCDEALLNEIAKILPAKIIYVSCNPATLSRDVKYLMQYDYSVKQVQPIDMFPHTSHVEAIILMTRSGSGDKK